MKKLLIISCFALFVVGCKGKTGNNGTNGINGSDGPVMTKYAGTLPASNSWISAPALGVNSLVSCYFSPSGPNGDNWTELGTPETLTSRAAVAILSEHRIYYYNMIAGEGYAIVILN